MHHPETPYQHEEAEAVLGQKSVGKCWSMKSMLSKGTPSAVSDDLRTSWRRPGRRRCVLFLLGGRKTKAKAHGAEILGRRTKS